MVKIFSRGLTADQLRRLRVELEQLPLNPPPKPPAWKDERGAVRIARVQWTPESIAYMIVHSDIPEDVKEGALQRHAKELWQLVREKKQQLAAL